MRVKHPVNTRVKRKRPYRLQQRARLQQQTRQRIVDAAVRLHTTVGPAQTTIKGVAEAAGVERLTVYRHFPGVDSLFRACTARSRELWPPPEVAQWAAIGDPEARLRTALMQMYAHYESRGDGLAVILRDSQALPAWLREALRVQRQQMIDVLMRGWPRRGTRLRRATLAHALHFHTYRTLVQEQGLKISDAVRLMIALARFSAR